MMKKKGFTLQEALITVGIIGIIAAITVPALTKILPNPYQTKYLKAYAALTSLTKEMLADSSLYWFNSNEQGCDGLECDTLPAQGSVPEPLIRIITDNGRLQQPDWIQKYAGILAYNMQVRTDDIAINVVAPAFPAFVTSDSSEWHFRQPQQQGWIQVDINFDVNKNAILDINNQNNAIPTVYTFMVNRDGQVTPVGSFGPAYLNDPTVTRKDVHLAENIEQALPNAGGPVMISIVDQNNALCQAGYKIFCHRITNIGNHALEFTDDGTSLNHSRD